LEQFIGLSEEFGNHLVKEDQSQYNLFDDDSGDDLGDGG